MNSSARRLHLNVKSSAASLTLGIRVAVLASALVLSACSNMSTTSAVGSPALSDAALTLTTQQIAAIIASPDRSAADRANDIHRKPAQMLAFIGIRPGMTVLDLSAARGYTTELLARAVGPNGRVYGQNPPPRDANSPPQKPSVPEGAATPMAKSASMSPAKPANAPETLAQRAAKPALSNIVPVVRSFEDPVPPGLTGRLDLVTFMFNYHDTGHWNIDRARLNKAVFAGLKPGGMYVIADHAGRPGTGISESGTLHRIEESFLRKEVEAAGFKLADEGYFLHNPNDPRDKNTPEPPQPKDEFVLKFIKP